MSDKRYYVRIRGKVLGPFSQSQLRALRDRGQFHSYHEVSEDRQSWASAAQLAEIFIKTSEPANPRNDVRDAPQQKSSTRPVETSDGWYYVDSAGRQHGPVDLNRLLALRASGTISNNTRIWCRGLDEWRPLAAAISERSPLPQFEEGRSLHVLDGLPILVLDPVGGLPRLCENLTPHRAFFVGLLSHLLGMVLSFLALVALSEITRMDILLVLRDQLRLVDRPRLILWALCVVFVPLLSWSAAIGLIRLVSRCRGSFGTDVLIAGAVNLPTSMLIPLIVVFHGNLELVWFLATMLLTLPVLMLGSALTRWMQLPDRGVIFAVPMIMIGSIWITKVIIVAVFGKPWKQFFDALFGFG
jgi:hypothetical protein